MRERKDKFTCPKHKVELVPGIAIQNTLTGIPDFIGDDEVCTFSYGGPGKVIECLKCPECGYSIYKVEKYSTQT